MSDDPRTLVSTDWLGAHLEDPDLRLVDASWYLPDAGRDARAEYEAAHIPGARFVDIDEVSDARSPGRFRGEEDEPRPGLRAGHIPGSRNVHYRDLLAADGTMRPPAELRETFDAAGVDLARPVVTTCGSGVTAAILSLALERLGHADHALYDGSWSEWGMYRDLEVATGP
jgi:thiosulfate/3-mercaptopyruvate sulfurtransferase